MPSDKKVVEYVDMTPTWEALLPVYLLIYESNPAKRGEALTELTRMAQAADKYVASQKVCAQCGIAKRPNGDHSCETCGEKI